VKKSGLHNDELIRKIAGYISGKMSDEERNAFEREAQRDPFLADALEGFELLNDAELKDDVSELKKRIKAGPKHRKYIFMLAVAAGILLILSVSVLMETYKSNSMRRMQGVAMKIEDSAVMMPEPEDEPVCENMVEPELPEVKHQTETKVEKKEVMPETMDNDEVLTAVENEESDVDLEFDMTTQEDVEEKQEESHVSEIQAPAPVAVKAAKSRRMVAEKTVLSISEDITVDAVPYEGIEYFKKKLEQELRDSIPGIKKLKIVFDIIISSSGDIVDVNIVSSNKKGIDIKVKEIILGGERWKPALKNNVSVQDTVRINLKIVR